MELDSHQSSDDDKELPIIPTTLQNQLAAAFETERLNHLYSLRVLDTQPQERFDRITRLAARVLDFKIALVSLIDRDRQWFKSICGLSITETPRNMAFCAHALREPEILVVENALEDRRFSDNPLVTGAPHIRFYAGAVLYSNGKLPLGTLCVIDSKPRVFSIEEQDILLMFARLVESELNSAGADQQDRVAAQLAANIDPITGFFNFREFKARAEALDNSLEAMTGTHANACARTRPLVVTIEIPRFDNLLRLQGLSESQNVAAGLAKTIKESLTDTQVLLGRYSRNSIIAYLPASTVDCEALGNLLCQRLQQKIDESDVLNGLELQLGISDKSDSMEQSLNQCVFAIDRLKGHRGISYSCFSEDDKNIVHRRALVSGAIKNAIAINQFCLYYQPKINLLSGCTVGLEALIRWRHPEFGFVSPPEIFSAAADVNLTVALDRWVIGTAIKHIRILMDTNPSPPIVSINLCAETLREPQTIEFITSALLQEGVPPRLLQIEILENTVIQDFDQIIDVLNGLHKMGILFALDDFGTGYSSLGYLKRLPIDTLKLDRSFINSIDKLETDAALARGIISLAHDLKMHIVAEGVETNSQLTILQNISCDSVQGYYFSKPITFDEIVNLLHDPKYFYNQAAIANDLDSGI